MATIASAGRSHRSEISATNARKASTSGYPRITLWTNDVLVAARRIYERAGFRLDRRDPHHSFGQDLVGEYWSRDL